MKGIFYLCIIVVVLVAAGVISISWNGSSATVDFHKEVAKERVGQVSEKVSELEASLKAKIDREKEQGYR